MRIDAVWTPPAQQLAYRRLLRAFAYPGTIEPLDAAVPGRPAWLTALAVLCDRSVSLADPAERVDGDDRPFLEARRASVADADFVLATGGEPPVPDFRPRLGTLESPERGATIVLAGGAVGEGRMRLEVRGPGVDGTRALRIDGFHAGWFERRNDWTSAFPMGVDVLLCGGGRVAALPRTAVVTLLED